MAINNPIVTDADIIQDAAVAIQEKDHGGKMQFPDMPSRIRALQTNTLDQLYADTLEVANIPSATTIGANAFLNKKALRDIIMPNVTVIGEGAFYNCRNLALSSLPNGLIRIERDAFYISHISITYLPNSIKTLGGAIFSGVSTIPYLDFSHFTHIPVISADTFFNTKFPLYFRDQQQLDEWAAATNWSTYADRFQIKPSEVL